MTEPRTNDRVTNDSADQGELIPTPPPRPLTLRLGDEVLFKAPGEDERIGRVTGLVRGSCPAVWVLPADSRLPRERLIEASWVTARLSSDEA